MKTPGFTLAEVLIALALLGVVAAFAIPKVLQSTSDQTRDTILKETLAALSDITYQASMQNIPESQVTTFYNGKMNAAKTCTTQSNLTGCWEETMVDPFLSGIDGDKLEGGVVLPNGVYITGISPCCDNRLGWTGKANTLLIDYNGPKGNNRIGDDQLIVNICFGDTPCASPDYQTPGIPGGSISGNAVFVGRATPQNFALYRRLTTQ